eukprot:scaffold131417_cov19-Prasinocladus_malaysianus.AAC.1
MCVLVAQTGSNQPRLLLLSDIPYSHNGALLFEYRIPYDPTPPVVAAVLCEDAEGVQEVPCNLGIFVDVNVGMNRTGLPREHASSKLKEV